jgi:predicted MFS family arabinose efflux permease
MNRQVDGVKERYSRAYRGWFLGLMVVISTLSVIDRISVLTLGGAIKLDLKLTDLQFGVISGFGFALFYALLGLPIARLADTSNRVRLVSIAVAIWSVFSTLCAFARGFLQLFLCRVVVGVGEAGVQPPTISVISDLYPPQRRGTALAILSIGIPAGSLIGPIAAGYLADAFSWRTVFLLLGVPGVLVAGIAWLTLREPPRGMSEARADAHEGPAPGVVAVWRHLSSKRSFWHLVIAMAVTNFAAAGVGSFLPQYFTRQFNLGMGQTGLMFGIIAAISTGLGTVSGGVLVDWISRHDRRWYVWLPALGGVLAAPLYIASFLIPNQVLALLALTAAGAFLFLYYAPSQVLLQNMVEPRMRGTAAFVFFLVSALVGFGLGPALLGFLSDHMAAQAFGAGSYPEICPGGAAPAGSAPSLGAACHAASAFGLATAMSIMSALYVWAAVHFALASRTIRGDLNP